MSADLLRCGYNFYINNYCSIAIRKYCGNISALGGTVLASIKTSLGMADPASDPLIKLKVP